MRLTTSQAILLILAIAPGCANVSVHKVPLQKRLAEKDGHVKGFRYYLSRPYVVVKQRIDLGTAVELARLVELRNKKTGEQRFGLEALVPEGATKVRRLFGQDGQPLAQEEWRVEPVKRHVPEKVEATKDPMKKTAATPRPWQPVAALSGPLNAADQGAAAPPVGQATPPKGFGLGSSGDAFGSITQRTETGGSLAAFAKDAPEEPDHSAFQVSFLPDFEEQYAIHNRNILAYSKYELHFLDGWQLTNAQGTYDSTEVAAKLLQSIGNAISAIGKVKKAALQKLPLAGGGAAGSVERGKTYAEDVLVVIARNEFIEPGLYKVLKPWEQQACPVDADASESAGHTVLRDLGIPTSTETTVRLVGGGS